MRIFDVNQYEIVGSNLVEWEETKRNVGLFLGAYKMARERVGISQLPKLTMSYSFVDTEYIAIQESRAFENRADIKQSFLRLHEDFVIGYSAIMHPWKPEITDRRRTIFMLRYVYGLPGSIVRERIHYQKNIVIEDSKKSIIQFASALSLIKKK